MRRPHGPDGNLDAKPSEFGGIHGAMNVGQNIRFNQIEPGIDTL